jgi:MtN3 and saliva related transmembrane protein
MILTVIPMNELLHVDWRVWVGFVAGALSTCAGMPQLYKAWRTRSTRDLSLTTLLMSNLGASLWLIYGIAILSLPLIVANGAGLTVLVSTLSLKIKYK